MEINLAVQLEPEFEKLERAGVVLVKEAEELQISDAGAEARAAALFLRAKDHKKIVGVISDGFVKDAHANWKKAVARREGLEQPADRVIAILNPRLAAFHEEKERARRQEEFRLQEEARKKAEEEKLEEAVAAEQMGQADVAENIMEAPTFIPTIVIPKAAAPDGVSYQDYWSAEVTDLMSLVKAVAAGQPGASISFLEANMASINGQARSLKTGFNIPGCKVVCKKVPKDGRR